MPAYEYACDACDNTFTINHLSSEPKPVCPHCGEDGLSRIYSSFVVGKSQNGIGNITKDFIASAKKDLEEQKQEALGRGQK